MSGGVCSNFLFTTSPEIDADFCPRFTEEETETEVTQLGKGVENRIQGGFQGPELLIRAAKKIVSQQVPGTILSTLLEPPSNAGRAPGTLFSLGLLEPGTYRSVGTWLLLWQGCSGPTIVWCLAVTLDTVYWIPV